MLFSFTKMLDGFL